MLAGLRKQEKQTRSARKKIYFLLLYNDIKVLPIRKKNEFVTEIFSRILHVVETREYFPLFS